MEAHRASVRDAALDAAEVVISNHGLSAVTMSRIAQDAGISRATLYKYFADVDAVLDAWHQRQVHGHLELLALVGGRPGTPFERLRDVLLAYAEATRREHSGNIASLLHQGEHVVAAQQHLRSMVAGILAEAAAAGDVRDDVDPNELATFCLHALTAAGGLDSDAAIGRLVDITTAGLRPASRP